TQTPLTIRLSPSAEATVRRSATCVQVRAGRNHCSPERKAHWRSSAQLTTWRVSAIEVRPFCSSRNKPLHHQAEQSLHGDSMCFHFVGPSHALECRVVKPENEVVPVPPAFGTVTAVDAVDRFEFLQPA